MDLLKRHYEKVILLGLFVLFICLMVLVQSVINSTNEVTEADLKLPERKPDFVNEKAEDSKFDTAKLRDGTRLIWGGRKGKDNEKDINPAAAVWADFVSAFPMAACPHCKDEKNSEYTMLIPLSSFSAKDATEKSRCPQCNKELPAAPEISLKELEELSDSNPDRDNDGVLDEIEKKYGMNSEDPFDGRYDLDGDGFANVFEIANEFLPNDPSSHPPYWWRLQIKKIEKIELPVKFMALSDNGAHDDKSRWTLQFNHPDRYGRNRIASSFRSIGGTIQIENRRYKIIDVERRLTPVKGVVVDESQKEAAKKGYIDTSRVFLEEVVKSGVKPDKLVMVVNQPAYSSDKRPVLVDTGDIRENRKEYALKLNDTIKIEQFAVENAMDGESGGKRSRNRVVATYRLKAVDDEKNMITLEEVVSKNKKDGTKSELIEITMGEVKVPVKMTPIKKVERTVENAGADNPDGAVKSRNRNVNRRNRR
ncbi:MAG: hypothetical protein J6W00_05055 [Lentisphaeria bacterium]|nr:hypothetical protein [Lentisphaeria bacterium]